MALRFFDPFKDASKFVGGKVRTLPGWLGFVLLAGVIIGVGTFLIWRFGLNREIVVGRMAQVATSPPDELWFSQNGDLLAKARYRNSLLSIWRFSPTFRVHSITNEIDVRRFIYGEELFALSRDASLLAYLNLDGDLTVRNLEQNLESAADISDNPRGKQADPVRGLAFTDTGQLALVRRSGKIEFRDPGTCNLIATTQIKVRDPIDAVLVEPFGSFLAVIPSPNSVIFTINLNSPAQEPLSHGYPLNTLKALAVSDNGRLAVAIGSRVSMTQADGSGDANIPLTAYGDITALSFYDGDTVLVGGNFKDIYLLKQNALPQKIVDAPRGVTAMAVNANRIAYAEPGGYSVYWHTKRRSLSTGGKITIGVASVLLAGLFGLYQFGKRSAVEEPAVKNGREKGQPLRLPAELPPDLVEACAAGECVLYAGAGLSAQSGLPIWKDFVHGLLEWAVENRFVNRTDATSFHAEIDTGDADPVADSIISRMNSPEALSALNGYLRRVFLKSSSPSRAHFLLRRLKLSAILTTNFDNLLERNYQANQIYTPQDAESLLSALTKRDFFILKLYGTLEQPDTVMVAPAQYESAITTNKTFSRFMQTLFVSRTLLFLGASLEGIETYLKGISLPKDTTRRHYALVAVSDNSWRAKADLLERRYGIKVLAFTPENDHAELNTFLKKLAFKVAAQPGETARQRQTTSRLKRVTLENIGPFENLSLDLDPELMVFLGDNGVGKSTILKAVAFALCGEEAEEHAWRLLRSGCSRGTIVLETDNKTSYVTEIARDEKSGTTTILANTAQPLIAEGWLGVGFPPLRTTSWTPPKGPEVDYKPLTRPMAEDLIPLVTGDIDPRLDNLKQWIVTQDYKSVKSDSKGKEDIYRRLIEKVFDGVAVVTEGMKISYGGVDASNRVILKTEDGDNIPLEGLSQGTISLVGWVGILMQRLFEIYATDENPTRRYALVLMDEIDAHMHPAWQRTLINHLREIFPQAQFIVTTHSPLVIGGLPVKQVTRFARNSKGKVVTLPIEQDMTFGYTDQILTSMLFGLPTTLDDSTEKKKKRYYQLYEMDERGDAAEEYEQLKQELLARVPPRLSTYNEKHAQQLSQVQMLHDMGTKLDEMSPGEGQVLLNRARNLRDTLKGEKGDDPSQIPTSRPST